jgi:MoaA/NifB/PqqE/SkfB family radical SAM enzyme/NAD-dependent SIR2 family protein deacetylase
VKIPFNFNKLPVYRKIIINILNVLSNTKIRSTLFKRANLFFLGDHMSLEEPMSIDSDFAKTVTTFSRQIEAIVNLIKNRKLLIFIGAGMSLPSGKPLWPDFVHGIINDPNVRDVFNEAERENFHSLVKKDEYFTVLQTLWDRAGAFVREFTTSQFGDIQPQEIKGAVRLLQKLPNCYRFITTNLDTILEKLLLSEPKMRVFVQGRDSLEKLPFEKQFILKIHGTVDDQKTWVLTKSQYDKAYRNATFQKGISDIFKKNEVLFLGCSLESDMFSELLKFYEQFKCPINGYAVLAAPSDHGKQRSKTNQMMKMGITPIWFQNPDKKEDKAVFAEQMEPFLELLINKASKLIDYPSALPAFLADLEHDPDFQQEIRKEIKDLAAKTSATCARFFLNIDNIHKHIREVEHDNGKLPDLRPAVLLDTATGLANWIYLNGKPAFEPCHEDEQFVGWYFFTDERIIREVMVPVFLGEFVVGNLLLDWAEVDWSQNSSVTDDWYSIRGRQFISLAQACSKAISKILEKWNIGSSSEIAKLCKGEIEVCVRHTKCQRGYIALWEPNGRLRYFLHGEGKEKFLDISATEGLCGKSLREGTTQTRQDIRDDPQVVTNDHNIRSELCVPISKGGVIIGVINIEHSDKAFFTQNSEKILARSAGKIAEKVRERDLVQINTISRIIHLSAEGLSLEEIFPLVEKYAKQIVRDSLGNVEAEISVIRPSDHEDTVDFHPSEDPYEDFRKTSIVPIRVKGNPIKLLKIKFSDTNRLPRRAFDQIATCCELATAAYLRHQNSNRQQDVTRLLMKINEGQKKNISREEMRRVLTAFIKEINNLLDATHSELFWQSDENQNFFMPEICTAETFYYHKGDSMGYNTGATLPLPVTTHVLATKKKLRIPNLFNSKYLEENREKVRWQKVVSATPFGTKGFEKAAGSYLGVPICENGTCLGMLRSYIDDKDYKPSFTEQDELILEAASIALRPFVKTAISKRYHYSHTWKEIPFVNRTSVEGTHTLSSLPENFPPQLIGYTYLTEEAKQARDTDRLLSLRLETSLACNLKCRYCCNDSGEAQGVSLPKNKQKDVIQEAKELGAKSIVFIGGGEFLLHNHDNCRDELLEFTMHKGLIPVIFSNGILINNDLAKKLNDYNATVILKLDSLHPEVQDNLAGMKKGQYSKFFKRALEALTKNGFADVKDKKYLRLGLSCVVTKTNYDDVLDVWKYCRTNDLFPNIEWLVPHGRAGRPHNRHLLLSTREIAAIRDKICEYDSKNYDFSWLKYTPRIGAGCLQFMYSLYVTYDGKVRPCAALWWEEKSVLSDSLHTIMHSYPYDTARHINEHLQGRCGVCGERDSCYGCRGLTFADWKERGKSNMEAMCSEDTSCPLCQGVDRENDKGDPPS